VLASTHSKQRRAACFSVSFNASDVALLFDTS